MYSALASVFRWHFQLGHCSLCFSTPQWIFIALTQKWEQCVRSNTLHKVYSTMKNDCSVSRWLQILGKYRFLSQCLFSLDPSNVNKNVKGYNLTGFNRESFCGSPTESTEGAVVIRKLQQSRRGFFYCCKWPIHVTRTLDNL